ncbi:MAG: transglycosylase domain-containing protein [Candidatus Niyogibacteria bacterium]|nr:transglycosylase domain-containing protein [Candidatus Niyogibacteria bacterium]
MKAVAKKIFPIATVSGILMVGVFSIWVLLISVKIPDFNTLLNRKVVQSTKIYDKTGKVSLYDVHQDIKRTVISFAEMPRQIKNATVAIEDDNFYYHGGIAPFSILRALLTDIFTGAKKQGGSTITQQLVKNSFLTPEKTFSRKLKELVLAIKIEQKYSKEKILELYLNEIPYGSSSYGIEAASQTFFNKRAKDLTLAESAYLAALPQAPSYYSPFGLHAKELKSRKDLILAKMADLKFITEEEKEAAQKENVVFIAKDDANTLKAPHFVMMVKDYLENKYGEDLVASGGLKVTTTLDWDLQKKAEVTINQFAEENLNKFNAHNTGMVATDPKTGKLLVMAGSKNYFAPPEPENCVPGLSCKFEGNFNVTLALRQPGSAFKPFAYATALKKGYAPDTALFDLQTEFNPRCNPDLKAQEKETAEKLKNNPQYKDECYHPENYDHVFRGPITMREALAQSINVPAVKTLYLAGFTDTLKTAKSMGITTLNDPERYGLTLVLGGGEVKLLDIVGAYGVFGNDGVRTTPTFIEKVEDANGKVLEEYQKKEEKILEPQIARLINSVLSDNRARVPAFGENSPLYFPGRDVAAKTGTTNDSRDAWIIGYTPNFALGAWAGNNDNSQMEKKVAGFIVAPMWNAFFKEALKSMPAENFIAPENPLAPKPVLRGEWRGGRVYLVDSVSKKLATDFTPPELTEEKVLTQIHSILYWLDKNNPLGPSPADPDSDPQFRMWEWPVRKWAAEQGIIEQTETDLPKTFDNIHKPEHAPNIRLTKPSGALSLSAESLDIKVEIFSPYKIRQVDFFLDNTYIGSKKIAPYEINFNLSQLSSIPNQIDLMIKAYDEVGNIGKLEQILNFQ